LSSFKITNRYATALIELSIQEKSLNDVSNELELIKKSIKDSRELTLFLQSPILKSQKKKDILTKIFSGKVSNLTMKFLNLVIDRNRTPLILEIIDHFFELRDKHLGIINVAVRSAAKFDKNQSEDLTKQLESYTNKKVKINFSLDSSLKGGFVVQLGDTVLDASLRHQLDLLKSKFLHGSEELN